MECHNAQEQLDFATLGHKGANEVELEAAKQHLQSCDVCHQAFEQQQQFDRTVALAMSDVSVPPGLADRLSSSIDRMETSSTARAPRRMALRRLSFVAAAVALLPILIWVLMPRQTVLNESSVQFLATLDPMLLPSESQPDAMSLPWGWASLRTVKFEPSARRALVNGINIPVMAFQYQINRKSSASGILVRLPQSQWYAVPAPTSFPGATVEYASFGTWSVWREGDSVFLCILHDNAHSMERLQNMISSGRDMS